MLDKEPLWYPSRNRFPFNPGITDRQLWAIGMIVAQWSMTEMIVDASVGNLIGQDEALKAEYARKRNSQQKLDFWETHLLLNSKEPILSQVPVILRIVRDLNAQRDEVVHRAWGGGLQGGSWAAAQEDSTDATQLRKTSDKQKTKHGDYRDTLKWKLSFNRLREMAAEMATLNRDLLLTFMPPPTPQRS